ncbi:hypothetical protein SESBI_49361, partial [Sesbania bispinosa]
VRLIPFRGDYFDESIMWSQGDDLGEDFKSMRMANNHHMNLDACQVWRCAGWHHCNPQCVEKC